MSTDFRLICDQLAELQIRRKFYIGCANRQTNAAKALVRRFMGWQSDLPEKDRAKIAARANALVEAALKQHEIGGDDVAFATALAADLHVIAEGLRPFDTARAAIELEMKQIGRRLPVAAWAKGVKGLGELGLAVIIGEAGNPARYGNPAKLWKRLGLAPLNGKAMSTWRREGGLTADDWTTAGYSPKRRAEVYACVAEPMAKHQLEGAEKSGTQFGRPKGPYGETYVKRRLRTLETHPDWTPKHSQMDALRIMTKHVILDLWVEWRRATTFEEPIKALLAAE